MPALLTVIEEVVAPVLHNNASVAVVDNVELPQLFTTVTTGFAGVTFGAEMPVPNALAHPFTVLFTA